MTTTQDSETKMVAPALYSLLVYSQLPPKLELNPVSQAPLARLPDFSLPYDEIHDASHKGDKKVRYTEPTSIDVPEVLKYFPELNPPIRATNPRYFRSLNYLSLPDLSDHAAMFTKEQRYYMRNLSAIHEQRYTSYGHLSNAFLLAATDGYHYEDVCSCMSFSNHRYIPCNFWRLCTQCAYWKSKEEYRHVKKLWKKHKDNIYFLTVSAGVFNFLTQQDQILEGYKTISEVVKVLARVDRQKILGSKVVEEQGLVSFIDCTVNAHAHIMLIDKQNIDYIVSAFESKGLDVKVTKADSMAVYERSVRYLFKSIKLQPIYAKEWTPETAEAVNQGLEAFTQGIGYLGWKRKSVRDTGIISSCKPKKTKVS